MPPTGTQIAYFHLCYRKLWLSANGLNMEHTSDLVAAGKQVEEQSYLQRAERWQQIELESIKIDHYDANAGIVREVKKSNKADVGHIAQLKYYLFVLERNGIAVQNGMLEYPKLRLTQKVLLTEEDRQQIPLNEQKIAEIISQKNCPPRIEKGICHKCSYFDFCYTE